MRAKNNCRSSDGSFRMMRLGRTEPATWGEGSKWAVGRSWLAPPARGEGPAIENPIEAFLISWRGSAQGVGEWASSHLSSKQAASGPFWLAVLEEEYGEPMPFGE